MFGSIFRWLAIINIMLAVFNMIPGFPLDGGRVLRSAIWAVTGRMEGATRVAAGVGSFIAYMFIMLGFYLLIFHQLLINGIWMVAIGMFLLWAARSSVVQMTTRRIFSTLRVSDVVEPSPPRVQADMSVQELVDTQILQHGHRLFFVEDGGSLQGMVTLQEVKATARHDWPVTPVRSIMIPASELVVAEPHVSLQTVMRTMDEKGIGQMPVIQGDRVIGVITREVMHRILRTQLELGGR
jgi:CBS domain-containing protein